MFTISKERTPVLAQQCNEIQALATKFNATYTSQKSVKVRIEWGETLNEIEKADLRFVNAKGEAVTDENPRKATFGAICNELGISRSGGYNYINEYITSKTYPQFIQDAAVDAGLNLALPHVQAAFGGMQAAGLIPKNAPDTLALKGIIATLAEAKPAKRPVSHKKGAERFQELLKAAFDYAEKEELEQPIIARLTAETAQTYITVDEAVREMQEMWAKLHRPS